MIVIFKKITIIWAIAALILILVIGGYYIKNAYNPIKDGQNASNYTTYSSNTVSKSIIYNNTQYGFSFTLPGSWRGYSIVRSKWDGLGLVGEQSGKVVETGPIILIRNPMWTAKNSRQDIPIMVFTLAQWNLLQQGVFHIGAAPIGPRELGRNNNYVFALPARYNFAFLPGYQEVETILENSPLKANAMVDNNLK